VLELFIKSSDELKETIKSAEGASASSEKEKAPLEKIPEEQQQVESGNDEDLAPMAMSRSISMPTTTKKPVIPQPQAQNQSLQMIKSLVQLLYLNDP
jgi:FtsZ-interacting cell division protein ZipA